MESDRLAVGAELGVPALLCSSLAVRDSSSAATPALICSHTVTSPGLAEL